MEDDFHLENLTHKLPGDQKELMVMRMTMDDNHQKEEERKGWKVA